MSNILAIVGRPNVGKSTLFNRLTQTRRAIVSDESGTTRDRQYGHAEWCGYEFSVIDTGGWVLNSDDIFEGEINRQVRLALDEADVILLLVDVNEGVTRFDMEVAHLLRQAGKPCVLAVNKVDAFDQQYGAAEFYKLGLGDPFIVSAENGLGTGDLLDEVCSRFSKEQTEEEVDELPRFAIVGRPNAGKSSLLNVLTGEERTIVTNMPGTTRDSIYTKYNKFGKQFYLVDTAGIRKKAKVKEDLEYYSVVRSIRAIENADVCILMIDATRGIEAQDLNIYQLVQKNKKGLVVCVNKWDLVTDKTNADIKAWEQSIRERMAPFQDFPILFTSALTKQRIYKVMETALQVYDNKQRKVPTAQLNEKVLPLIENYPPPAIKGKYIKVKYCTQLPDTQIPTFIFFANLPQYVKEPYRRFLENKLRSWWDFTGTPIQLFFRAK
ncbi:MAG: ribosome biogenesis GTPase Der [Paludibacteraceae bacterium]|nr:ribosome biogenesis GTPase Der [Paludibacteraceae bacterium]